MDGIMGRHIDIAAKGNPCSLLMLNGDHSSVVEQREVEKIIARAMAPAMSRYSSRGFRTPLYSATASSRR